MLASQPPVYHVWFSHVSDPPIHNDMLERENSEGIKMVDINHGSDRYMMWSVDFENMTPVTYTKDVPRIDYKKGEYEFGECGLQ